LVVAVAWVAKRGFQRGREKHFQRMADDGGTAMVTEHSNDPYMVLFDLARNTKRAQEATLGEKIDEATLREKIEEAKLREKIAALSRRLAQIEAATDKSPPPEEGRPEDGREGRGARGAAGRANMTEEREWAEQPEVVRRSMSSRVEPTPEPRLTPILVDDSNSALVAIAEAGIESLVALARDGTEAQKEWGAATLLNIAANDANGLAIAEAGGIAPLVALARDGTEAQKENAAGALRNLAANDANKVAIAEAGGIAPLVALARDGTEAQKGAAAAALAVLAANDANKAAIAREGGIAPLRAGVAVARDELA